MKKYLNRITILIISVTLFACSTEDDLVDEWKKINTVETAKPGIAGSLDLSRYIALGNSLTAGFADGALYTEGQDNSYPNLLAKQFAQVSTDVVFNQPEINSINGFNASFSNEKFTAGRTELSLTSRVPVPTAGEAITVFTGEKTTLSNFGVPGLRLSHLTQEGLNNPYFSRFASNPSTSSVLGDAMEVKKSFFSLWLGANDYLFYATNGGTESDPLTTYSASQFGTNLAAALTELTSDKTPGIVLDLPPVVALPFFQAIAWDGVRLDSETLITQLNTNLQPINEAINGTTQVPGGPSLEEVGRRLISYKLGNNPILVHDETLDDLGSYFDIMQQGGQITPEQRSLLAPYEQSRPLVEGELVLLSAGAVLNTEADGDTTTMDTPIGVVIPLGFSFTAPPNGDQYYLTLEEQQKIIEARVSYNFVINETVTKLNAEGADIALVSVQPTFADALGLTKEQATALNLPTSSADGVIGLEVNGVTLYPDFSPNGLFTTDGVHPNPRTHGIVANLMIDAINKRWGASIPKIDILALRGTFFQP